MNDGEIHTFKVDARSSINENSILSITLCILGTLVKSNGRLGWKLTPPSLGYWHKHHDPFSKSMDPDNQQGNRQNGKTEVSENFTWCLFVLKGNKYLGKVV